MSNKGDRTGAVAVAEFIEERLQGEPVKTFARRAGVNNTLISQWKSGKTDTPDVRSLLKIADALGVDRIILLQKAGIVDGEPVEPPPLPHVPLSVAIQKEPGLTQHQRKLLADMVQQFTHTPTV